MKNRLLTLLVAVAALTALAAGPAHAAKPPKFKVSIYASQVTKWKQPYYETANNCFNRPWRQGEGKETVQMRGSGVAYAQAVGRNTFFTYFSPNYGPGGKLGIPLKATNERSRSVSHGNKPGPCGGGTPTETEQFECGKKSGKAWGQLSIRGNRRLSLGTRLQPYGALSFTNCDVDSPPGVTQADLTEISQRAAAKDLLNRKLKKHVVIAGKRFKHVLYPDAARIDIETYVYWKITLKRIG
jgi:hypothetical protein